MGERESVFATYTYFWLDPKMFRVMSVKSTTMMVTRGLSPIDWRTQSVFFLPVFCLRFPKSPNVIYLQNVQVHQFISFIAKCYSTKFLFSLCQSLDQKMSIHLYWMVNIRRPTIYNNSLTLHQGKAPLKLQQHRIPLPGHHYVRT